MLSIHMIQHLFPLLLGSSCSSEATERSLGPSFGPGKFKIRGYVTKLESDPAKIVVSLCTSSSCRSATPINSKEVSKFLCRLCGKMAKPVFCLQAEILATDPPEFHHPLRVFCSGSIAENLLKISAQTFLYYESVRYEVLVKWARILQNEFVVQQEDGTKQFHLIESVTSWSF